MLPMRFFRSRAFTLANVASLFMFFGMFGSIFLLAQFFQTVQGYSPLGAGLRILPWTLAPMFIAPIAGALSDRISPRLIIGTGLALQSVALAWIGLVSTPDVPYSSLVAPFIVAGIGMALFFAPVANVVLSAVRPQEEGQASGANNSIRELGGVFGVAVLAAIFARAGGYESAATFCDGTNTAVLVGARGRSGMRRAGGVRDVPRARHGRRRRTRRRGEPARPLRRGVLSMAAARWPSGDARDREPAELGCGGTRPGPPSCHGRGSG